MLVGLELMNKKKVEIIDLATGIKQIFKLGKIISSSEKDVIQCLYNGVIWTHCPRDVLKGEVIEEEGFSYELL